MEHLMKLYLLLREKISVMLLVLQTVNLRKVQPKCLYRMSCSQKTVK